MDLLVAKVVHHIVQFLVQIELVVACGVVALLASLIFPSTRAALARWLHRRTSKELDQGDALAQLAAADAQLAALRSEVYALRREVAGIQAVDGAPTPGSRPPASTRGGSS